MIVVARHDEGCLAIAVDSLYDGSFVVVAKDLRFVMSDVPSPESKLRRSGQGG